MRLEAAARYHTTQYFGFSVGGIEVPRRGNFNERPRASHETAATSTRITTTTSCLGFSLECGKDNPKDTEEKNCALAPDWLA